MRAIVLAAVVALGPVGAWGQSVVYPDRDPRVNNETRWRASIENDIKNGGKRSRICSDAQASAAVSDNLAFKDWAYGIARQYCDDQAEAPTQPSGAAPPPEPPAQINGVTVRQCSHGMPCLGQLQRAMGIWE